MDPWWGKSSGESTQLRRDLVAAVPAGERHLESLLSLEALLLAPEHTALLRSLEWVVDMEVGFAPGRLVCIHAGLHNDLPANEQITLLQTQRDCNPRLMKEKACRAVVC